MDTSPYVPIPLVIYFVFCTNVWVFILFYFNLGLKLGAVPHRGTLVPLHLPLLGFSFFSFLFFCALYYKFVLYITRGVPNKAVEKKKRRQQQQQQKTLYKEHFPLYLPICNILCGSWRGIKARVERQTKTSSRVRVRHPWETCPFTSFSVSVST